MSKNIVGIYRKLAKAKYKALDPVVRDHLLDAKMHLKDAESDLDGISDELKHKVALILVEINTALGCKSGD